MIMTPGLRKFALTTHVTASVGWLATWGLFRHYWIVTKLLLTVQATILLLVHTQLIDRVATRAAEATLSTGDLRQSRIELVAKAGAALLALLVATTLSVYKPWGMTPYGLRMQNEATAASRATTTRQTAPWGGYVLFGIIGLVLLVLVVHLAGGGMHGH